MKSVSKFTLGVAVAVVGLSLLAACSPSEEPREAVENEPKETAEAGPVSPPVQEAAPETVVGTEAATSDLQLQALEWRNIGPFNGGRGTTVVGHPNDKMVFFFGHGSGGLWKTEDAGTTWLPVGAGQFNYASVGAMAIYEKNPDIMYVGLGEPQMRQSVSWGDGMYKSVDGGETWQHIGLSDSLHISRVRVHPHNSDIVFVSSLGHAFGPNEERGVFRTTDGGETWERVLFKNEGTGAIDLVMSPDDPNLLFAALWEFERKAWGAKPADRIAVSGARVTAVTPGRRSRATTACPKA